MALTKPILYSQSAFDATQEHTFTFNVVGGDQVVRNRLIITNQETGVVAYDGVQVTYSFVHTVPSGILTNGVYYSAYLITYNINEISSPQSTPIQFYCYSTPSFNFTNIPAGSIITNTSYSFELTYDQLQGEKLSSYTVNLYNAQRSLISTSGNLYVGESSLPTIINYTFTGFNDNDAYFIQAEGTTVEGTQINTDFIQFTVKYTTPNIFSVVELSNNCTGGYVVVKSNIAIINGKSNPDPPIYINNSQVDARSIDSYVEWDEHFNIEGDFTASLWGEQFNVDKPIIKMNDNNGNTLVVTYRKQLDRGYYADLIVTNNDITYYVYSNFIVSANPNIKLQFWFRRIGSIYEIILHKL